MSIAANSELKEKLREGIDRLEPDLAEALLDSGVDLAEGSALSGASLDS
ncbi:hypothetical protein IH922_06930 [candidate division KSB1 bacterium]|nr:hypothetical protein [candidate division KSB1 bacterium]